jgi:hypothetical protein
LGNTNSADELNCRTAPPALAAVIALEVPLHPENKIGSPAAAPAPSIDCTNLRRVKRN